LPQSHQLGLSASFLPWARTKAERLADCESRLWLEKSNMNRGDYVSRIVEAARKQWAEQFQYRKGPGTAHGPWENALSHQAALRARGTSRAAGQDRANDLCKAKNKKRREV
jgi:hypothetical protein